MKWYVVVRGLRPGVYESAEEARAQVEGVSDSMMRAFSSREEAEAYFAKALAKKKVKTRPKKGVVEAHPKPEDDGAPSAFLARTDGGFRKGVGYAAAVLLTPSGQVAGTGRFSFPRTRDSGEAELRGLLLALAMAPRGSVVKVETDRSDLPVFWEREKPDPWGIVPALKAVARALDLRVDVVRVPRKRVQAAHDGAGRARAERERAKRDSAKLSAFLDSLPERYRMSALSLMERFLEDGLPPSRFSEWLKRGTSETRKLLLEALPETDFEGLLLALARLDGAAREALKGKDRERAWEKIPPRSASSPSSGSSATKALPEDPEGGERPHKGPPGAKEGVRRWSGERPAPGEASPSWKRSGRRTWCSPTLPTAPPGFPGTRSPSWRKLLSLAQRPSPRGATWSSSPRGAQSSGSSRLWRSSLRLLVRAGVASSGPPRGSTMPGGDPSGPTSGWSWPREPGGSGVYRPQRWAAPERRGTVRRRSNRAHWREGGGPPLRGRRHQAPPLRPPRLRPLPGGEDGHPTQKPLALARYLVETYSEPGGLVVDPYAGSGTFGVAALELGRRFVGAERDPTWREVALRRLSGVTPRIL